ncbi:hypothetical protein M3226_31055 [Neobacillus cucumis]|uniref:hypothetical protein n=1 Tax=Neobacillus cucumis TaxID=1740721 RepID=UPI00203DED20|nr:hypothetical protein [Neobacillus cucumis]MCM3729959.1 hypothetical protein [Neobacillus cucumis]
MKRWLLIFIVVAFNVFSTVGCSSRNIEKIDVYQMVSFSDVKENSLISFTDSKDVINFVKEFKKANKEPGIVDMIDPEYKVNFGDESYFLWLNEEHATIMNVKDTHTIYTLPKSSTNTINQLLN